MLFNVECVASEAKWWQHVEVENQTRFDCGLQDEYIYYQWCLDALYQNLCCYETDILDDWISCKGMEKLLNDPWDQR